MTKVDQNRIGIVANTSAGVADDLRRAVYDLRDAGVEVAVRVAWEADQATSAARDFLDDGYGMLVAAGGDGTINAAVEACWEVDADADVGVLPFGTANDFATGLDLPATLHEMLRLEPKPTDIGLLTSHDRVFVNAASGGFGAEVTAETDPRLKATFGGLAYVFSGIGRLAEVEPFDLEVESDRFSWNGPTIGFVVGNGRQSGGGFDVCRMAEVDDGLLDLVVAPAGTAASFKAYVVDRVVASEEVVYEQVERVTLRTSREVQINLDGEPVSGDVFTFEVAPGAVKIRR